MNHDILHCKGEYCSLRDLCRRYIAHKEAVEMKYKHIAYAVPQNVGNECESFWRDHHEENN